MTADVLCLAEADSQLACATDRFQSRFGVQLADLEPG